MVDLAIRNGTYVPPTPHAPSRPIRVDMSKKPELWEAYLGGGGAASGGGWQPGSFVHGSGKELDTGTTTNWKLEYSRDWESMKPIYAGYHDADSESLISVPRSGSTPNLIAGLSPPVSIPVPTPIVNPSAARGDDDEANRRTAEVPTGSTAMPSLFTRARIFLNPNSAPSSSADNGTNDHSNTANISLTKLNSNSPLPTLRVAVLIAMPSAASSNGSSSISTTTPPLSDSFSSSLSSKAQPTTSQHLPRLSSPSLTLEKVTDDEEQPLPLLEMGVADVVIGRSEKSTWDRLVRREKEKTNSRGSSYAEP